MLAIADKVVIRADDLLTWIDHRQAWQWGLRAASCKTKGAGDELLDAAAADHVPTLKNTQLDFTDVNHEKCE